MTTPNMQLSNDPFVLFNDWFKDAKIAHPQKADVISLATVDAQGKPSVRIVLFKGFYQGGFTFYTNYESRKGQELKNNPHVAFAFYWSRLGKQVRVEGKATVMSHDESEKYFHSRPRDSQLGAWASPQSQPISSQVVLKERYEELNAQYDGQTIPCPPFWGGYVVHPERIEFWKDQPYRLHERVCYTKKEDAWTMTRLAP